jgi:WD40 repeat protein
LGLGVLPWLKPTNWAHSGPVNSVQFSGQGTEVLSGSNDQTIRRWRVQNQALQYQSRIGGDLEKAVRVVRYRPVNNDQMAIGFENGEIQVANLVTGTLSFLKTKKDDKTNKGNTTNKDDMTKKDDTTNKDDRVFDLVFSRDARTLYSGHGSGWVRQWDLTKAAPPQKDDTEFFKTGFAIQAMALVGNKDRYLAIAGQFNSLVLLDTALTKPGQPATANPDSLRKDLYPFNGSSFDYITSLSVAEQQPTLLAMADTQGYISLWDTKQCVENGGPCKVIDQRWSGHGGMPVRAVALSASGCFLASVGDNGQVKLWPVDVRGARRSNAFEERVLERADQPLTAVDVVETRDSVLVTRGGNDNQVRLNRVSFEGDKKTIDQCPVLAGGGS